MHMPLGLPTAGMLTYHVRIRLYVLFLLNQNPAIHTNMIDAGSALAEHTYIQPWT